MKLPIFKGWIVDYRLREFRRGVWGDVIPFDSDKGEDLLLDYMRSLDVKSVEYLRIADVILG